MKHAHAQTPIFIVISKHYKIQNIERITSNRSSGLYKRKRVIRNHQSGWHPRNPSSKVSEHVHRLEQVFVNSFLPATSREFFLNSTSTTRNRK